jgi:hypothetical protein
MKIKIKSINVIVCNFNEGRLMLAKRIAAVRNRVTKDQWLGVEHI